MAHRFDDDDFFDEEEDGWYDEDYAEEEEHVPVQQPKAKVGAGWSWHSCCRLQTQGARAHPFLSDATFHP